jgi:hypothetical protein
MTLPTSNAAGLHVRYEKAGLVLDALPIPWNADAVIVEVNVSLPKAGPRDKQDFTLKLSTDAPPAVAEVILQPKKKAPARVFFRIPVPAQTCSAEVFWRDHPLGKAEVPVVAQADFLHGLALRMEGFHIGIKGGHTAPCQVFVSGQCQTLSASAVIESAGPLAPIADLDLHLEVGRDQQPPISIPIAFTSGQLRGRQTLLTAFLPKLRQLGEYTVSWRIGTFTLHTQRLKVISKKTFLRSLRITTTRFLVAKESGAVNVVRWLPHHEGQPVLAGINRVAPCFYVCSGETGVAGLAGLTLRAVFADDTDKTLGSGEMLVTDGPMPFLPVTLAADELGRIKHFTLETSVTRLGNLPLVPTPRADFTAEGGFAPLDDFLWSAAAEEQLNDRLGKLLDGG